ncbi:MAG: hypothetical protein E7261_12800 [Lachnospiraceae bacterium]|nr:hypothetical protein [Lachnospiraceae bacterium]
MAKFKVYRPSEEDDGKNKDTNYTRKVLFHKGRKLALVLVFIFIVAAFVVGYRIYIKNRTFTGYDVVSIAKIKQSADSRYLEFGNNVLRYNMDGIACIEKDNDKAWEISYRMKYPIVALCGDYGAVASQKEDEIYVFNKSGLMGRIEVNYPIIDIDVSAHGVVAVNMEYDGMNYVDIYEHDGTRKVASKTSLEGNGYPLDIALSNDGQKLMVSYLDIAEEALKSSIVFYNFSEVGENYIWNMVGAYDEYYDKTIIPHVAFIDNETACAVGDDRITIFAMKEIPEIKADIALVKELESYFVGEEYLALVFDNGDNGGLYRAEIYDTAGKKQLDYELDTSYKAIRFIGDYILIYNEYSCKIINMSGTEVFSQVFDGAVVLMEPLSLTEYILITDSTISEIKLK